ncbi:UbiA prenyltransferase [Alicycliphilus sp. B1]|nr:UbiA prenyltransferase [Alicycliphilus sp. B1]
MARGLGEVAVALAWWLVVLGADYVQRRQFFVIPAATAASFALLAANILLANGFPMPRRCPGGQEDPGGAPGARARRLGLSAHRPARPWLLALAVWLLIPPDRALWGWRRCRCLAAGALLLRHAGQPQRLRRPSC